MDFKDKESPEFKKLKKYVFDGEYFEIDNWFKKYNLSPKEEKNLIMRIINEYYFFSFQSDSTNAQTILQESQDRELAILKNLSCENQLKLLGPTTIEEFNHKHFELIISKAGNKKIIKNSSTIVWAITDLLNKEKFEEIDKIQEMVQDNILEQQSNSVIANYGDKNSRGTRHLSISEKKFSPKFNIIFMPSHAKEEYLKNKGIQLPTSEEASKLKDLIKTSMENSTHWRIDDIKEIEHILNEYIIKSNYWELNNDLKTSNRKVKKTKI